MIQGRDARKFLGHFKCHFEPQISPQSLKQGQIRSSEWSQHLQQKSLIQSVNEGVNGWVHDRLFCRHRHSGSVHGYSAAEIRSRSNVWKEHTYTAKDTDMIKLTFCCKFWVYSLRMTLFGWFWWYSWHKMAYKMFQEFPTIFLNITINIQGGGRKFHGTLWS